MPTLKQISCSLELGSSNTKLKEYGARYSDGHVETFIAVPDTDVPFTIHLNTEGYIAPGIAFFVFMDGKYQCNRNRVCLPMPGEGVPSSDYDVEFRLRQKEEKTTAGTFVVRDWSFAKLNRVNADKAPSLNPQFMNNVGSIEIIALRCKTEFDDMPPRRLADRKTKAKPESGKPAKKEAPAQATKDVESAIGGMAGLFDGTYDVINLDGGGDGRWTDHMQPAPPPGMQWNAAHGQYRPEPQFGGHDGRDPSPHKKVRFDSNGPEQIGDVDGHGNPTVVINQWGTRGRDDLHGDKYLGQQGPARGAYKQYMRDTGVPVSETAHGGRNDDFSRGWNNPQQANINYNNAMHNGPPFAGEAEVKPLQQLLDEVLVKQLPSYNGNLRIEDVPLRLREYLKDFELMRVTITEMRQMQITEDLSWILRSVGMDQRGALQEGELRQQHRMDPEGLRDLIHSIEMRGQGLQRFMLVVKHITNGKEPPKLLDRLNETEKALKEAHQDLEKVLAREQNHKQNNHGWADGTPGWQEMGAGMVGPGRQWNQQPQGQTMNNHPANNMGQPMMGGGQCNMNGQMGPYHQGQMQGQRGPLQVQGNFMAGPGNGPGGMSANNQNAGPPGRPFGEIQGNNGWNSGNQNAQNGQSPGGWAGNNQRQSAGNHGWDTSARGNRQGWDNSPAPNNQNGWNNSPAPNNQNEWNDSPAPNKLDGWNNNPASKERNGWNNAPGSMNNPNFKPGLDSGSTRKDQDDRHNTPAQDNQKNEWSASKRTNQSQGRYSHHSSQNNNGQNSDWKGNGQDKGWENAGQNWNAGSQNNGGDNAWGAPGRGSQKSSAREPTNDDPKAYIKPYWKTWNQPLGASDNVTPEKVREEPRNAYNYPASPLPAMPSNKAKDASHAVQTGKGTDYSHKTRRPVYIDTMEAPYAVFSFKYRSKGVLEKILKRSIDDADLKKVKEQAERDKYTDMPKHKLVEELMAKRSNGKHGSGGSNSGSKKAGSEWSAKAGSAGSNNDAWGTTGGKSGGKNGGWSTPGGNSGGNKGGWDGGGNDGWGSGNNKSKSGNDGWGGSAGKNNGAKGGWDGTKEGNQKGDGGWFDGGKSEAGGGGNGGWGGKVATAPNLGGRQTPQHFGSQGGGLCDTSDYYKEGGPGFDRMQQGDFNGGGWDARAGKTGPNPRLAMRTTMNARPKNAKHVVEIAKDDPYWG